jgi:hypothetical protein
VFVIDLIAAIENQRKPTEPQRTILRVLKERFEGKMLTKRVIEALREATGDDSIRDIRQYGHTEIEWGNYRYGGSSKAANAGMLSIARCEKNVYINTSEIRDMNHFYFEGTDFVNAQIDRILSMPEAVSDLASDIEAYRVAKAILDAARKQITAQCVQDAPFGMLHYEIDKLIDGEEK